MSVHIKNLERKKLNVQDAQKPTPGIHTVKA